MSAQGRLQAVFEGDAKHKALHNCEKFHERNEHNVAGGRKKHREASEKCEKYETRKARIDPHEELSAAGIVDATSATGTLSMTGTSHTTSMTSALASVAPTRDPPAPPRKLTAQLACDPLTDEATLWQLARGSPQLRKWIVANPSAQAHLLEYIAQAGGPGVKAALSALLDSLEEPPLRELHS